MCPYQVRIFGGKVTWSMENWAPILFEMAEIKSPGNSEGQSEQREEGLQGEGIEKKKRPASWAAVSLNGGWNLRAHIQCKRHKGNLQMQGCGGKGREGKKKNMHFCYLMPLCWLGSYFPPTHRAKQNNFTYGGDGGPSRQSLFAEGWICHSGGSAITQQNPVAGTEREACEIRGGASCCVRVIKRSGGWICPRTIILNNNSNYPKLSALTYSFPSFVSSPHTLKK